MHIPYVNSNTIPPHFPTNMVGRSRLRRNTHYMHSIKMADGKSDEVKVIVVLNDSKLFDNVVYRSLRPITQPCDCGPSPIIDGVEVLMTQ